MKKKILGILITSIVVFSGCSNKATVNDVNKDKGNDEVKKVSTEVKPNSNEVKPGDSASEPKGGTSVTEPANNEVKPINPGTTPQLSSKQKAQINSNVNSTIKNIDDVLKSIETPNDVKVE